MMVRVLTKRRRYRLTYIAIILSLIYHFPVFARLPLHIPDTVAHPVIEATIADSSKNTPLRQTSDLFQQLNLTQLQQQQIHQIHRQYRQQISQHKNAISRLQQQLSDMMVGTAPVDLLWLKNRQLNTLLEKTRTLRFESMLATREILTPQQRQKFRELVELQLSDRSPD